MDTVSGCREFFGSLRIAYPRACAVTPEGKVTWERPEKAVHAPSRTVYVRDEQPVGRGSYGEVHAYRRACDSPIDCGGGAATPPYAFAIKFIDDEADAEVSVVLALPAAIRGVVPAALVGRRWCVGREACVDRCECSGGAMVGMPLLEDTLCGLADGTADVEQALVAMRQLADAAASMWGAGLAYCDIKTSNVMRRGNDVLLSDLGGAVPRRGGGDGVFTFPPQRAFQELRPAREAKLKLQDGLTQPVEQDVVWALGVLLMALVLGNRWVTQRFSSASVRRCAATLLPPKQPVTAAALRSAFCELADDARACVDEVSIKGAGGARCFAHAAALALDAWEGRARPTIGDFACALHGTGWWAWDVEDDW